MTVVSISVQGVALIISAEGRVGFAEDLKGPPFIGGDVLDAAYLQISEILQAQQGFSLAGYKARSIKRRIAARIRAVGMTGTEPYIVLLAESPDEQQKLLTALSIHVSHFFRNPSTYRELKKKVLPVLLQRSRVNHSKLRIWSIGCAYGEEPYSLALLLQRFLLPSDQLAIIATDLSSAALQRAKAGQYDPSRLTEVPERLLREYFQPQGKEYRLAEEIRKMVQFFRHDILSEQPFYRADLILCRNVLIYFSREQQRRILQILAAALPAGGFLVLGRAETLVTSCRELFRCINPAERIYQRLETDEQLLPMAYVQQLQDF